MRSNLILLASVFPILILSVGLHTNSPVVAGGGLTVTGPPPPAYCPPYPPAKTGQTGCWDENGNFIDCAGTGQDGESQVGVSVPKRFTDNLDGTVTDNLTGLIWLKDANCFDRRSWTNALGDANTLADAACGLTDGSVAGDWRLPNVRELQSLMDYGQYNPSLPPDHQFSGVQLGGYGSSTTYTAIPDIAYIVNLNAGLVSVVNKSDTTFVWPVRGPE